MAASVTGASRARFERAPGSAVLEPNFCLAGGASERAVGQSVEKDDHQVRRSGHV
jgi:hypothetical protein